MPEIRTTSGPLRFAPIGTTPDDPTPWTVLGEVTIDWPAIADGAHAAFVALDNAAVKLTTILEGRAVDRWWEALAPGYGPPARRMRAAYRRRQLARRRRNRR